MTTTKRTTPAPNLSELFQASDKTLAQIARESGLSLSHVSRLRSHNRLPSVTTAAKLSVVLDVPLGDLIAAAANTDRPGRQRPRPSAINRNPGNTDDQRPQALDILREAEAAVTSGYIQRQRERPKAA